MRDSPGSQDGARRKGEDLAEEALALAQKQTGGDFQEAIVRYKKSAGQFKIAGLPERAAETYVEIGGISFILSKYPQALDAYDAAIQLTGTDEMRCTILARMARTYSIMGRNFEAMRYSGEAVSLCEKLPDPKERAEAYEVRGEALYSSSDHSQAIEQFKLALTLFEKNDPGRALALLMLAEVRFEEGVKDEGVRLALEALQLWSSLGDEDGVAQARATLGIFSMTVGHFETARCYCEEAQKIFKKVGDEDHRAKALNTLGSTSMGMGEAESALKYWLQARAAYARLHDRLGEASAISATGKALVAMHRYQELPQLFQAELRLAKQAASKSMAASALADIAGIEGLNSQYQRAEGHYLQSVEIYHSLGLTSDEGDILALLAELYLKQSKYELAISSLERAFTIRERNKEVEDEARIRYDLAYVYRKMGRLENASAAIQPAIPIIEKQRSMIGKFDSRASYFAAVHNYYALHIDLLMHHHSGTDDEFAVHAFEASERSKVRSLIDWLVESDQALSCDAVWRREAEEALEAAPNARSLQGSEDQTLSPVTLRQAQALIRDDDAILLEYALGDENSYLWAVTENEILSYQLPNAKKLEYLVQRLRTAVTAKQPGGDESIDDHIKRMTKGEQDYKRYSWQLAQLLLGPVALRGKKRIIFVPEGPLQYVPFSALPLRDVHGKSSILADKHEVVILPSASALAAIRKAAKNRPRPSLPAAVFANPLFTGDRARAKRINAANRSAETPESTDCEKDIRRMLGPGPVPPLPEAHREAQAIEQYLAGRKKVFVAEHVQASLKTLLALDLGAYRLLVFATHTFLDGKRPEKSMILLSLVDESGTPQNGCVRLSEINKFKLSADLVVLSSCESALGKELSSEGIIGLPRSFLRAGARSIIATLWAVDDQATADLMTRFYYHLHLGESPASALRNSQLDVRHDKRWSNEYFWAAFVLQGDYRISSLN